MNKPWSARYFLLLSLFFLSACSGLLFYPSSGQYVDPGQYGLFPETVRFQSRDGTQLSGWFFRSLSRHPKGTVIQFHGNAENMTSHFQSLAWVTAQGYHFFTFDYRGYGSSAGKPGIPGVNQDAVAAYEYLLQRQELEELPIILYGQSLGGVILLKALEQFPSRRRIACVIVEGSFLSYQEIAREKMNDIWLTWPVQHLAYLLFSDRYAATDAVKSVAPIPLLVIHGDRDPVIPYRFGEEIYQKAAEPKTLWTIENGRHIDAMLIDGGRYRRQLLQYLEGRQ